ncbi:hypothetical protein [Candidatus Paracaedibacter symbiosus]|nr:hypothetical protein [Candidatus Paracaedibacter symbiosus]
MARRFGSNFILVRRSSSAFNLIKATIILRICKSAQKRAGCRLNVVNPKI